MAIGYGYTFELVTVVLTFQSFALGLSNEKTCDVTESWSSQWTTKMSLEVTGEKLIDQMDSRKIESNLKYLTSKPHMAGTRADFEQADYIRSLWEDEGLDQVTLTPYEVALSFPKPDRNSKVVILDDEGVTKFTSALRETPEEGVVYDETVPPAYSAFSAEGVIETDELVFANYGAYEDFQFLEEKLKISVKGKLLLIRYGKFFRGDKVQNAQRFKAVGVILYSDPADYSSNSTDTLANYPNSWWLPGEGVQRGTINWKDGDPSTPMYPALDGVFRVRQENWKDLPQIPVHPVGFNDAQKILVHMSGPEVPPSWRGGLNVTYRAGPKLRLPGWKIRLEVYNEKKIVPTYNVVGFIRGRSEPDRYVIYGNHRDAWVFGSVDPSSATATLLEVVRSYSVLLKQGWRPRRSLLFCSWGASEQGYMGVTEWVEEHLALLGARAVAYLNVDIAVVHNYNLLAVASPLLHQLMSDAARHVPAPHSPSNASLLDLWSERNRFTGEQLVGYGLSSVSDHAPFYQRVGIPCTYMLWMPNPADWPNVDYPLYHSTYETFDAMKKFLDPDFAYHLALGRMWAWMGLSLAESAILPFKVQDETVALRRMVQKLEEKYHSVLAEHVISLVHLKRAVDVFESAADNFQERLAKVDNANELYSRMVNDQLIQVEKAFIYSEGLPRRSHFKNVIFGTSVFDQYSGSMFPGVEEALIHLTLIDTDAQVVREKAEATHDEWDEVRQQIGIVTSVIRAAAKILRNFDTGLSN